jgi:transcriptional regulator with XRE-family HTH domain
VYEKEEHSDKAYLIALGKKIKELRLQKKLSQTEIAYRCGFDKSNYNTIESGKRNVTVMSLLKISKALDIDLIDLFQF